MNRDAVSECGWISVSGGVCCRYRSSPSRRAGALPGTPGYPAAAANECDVPLEQERDRASHLLKYEFVGFRLRGDVRDGSADSFGIIAKGHGGRGGEVITDVHLHERVAVIPE